MRSFVLDPSVVVKWYVPELLSGEASELKNFLSESALPVAVPALFFAETANVLWKKSRLKNDIFPRDARRILKAVIDLPFLVTDDRLLLSFAQDIAARQGVTVYDALYLALAVEKDAALVTADDRLVRRLSGPVARRAVPLSRWRDVLADVVVSPEIS